MYKLFSSTPSYLCLARKELLSSSLKASSKVMNIMMQRVLYCQQQNMLSQDLQLENNYEISVSFLSSVATKHVLT